MWRVDPEARRIGVSETVDGEPRLTATTERDATRRALEPFSSGVDVSRWWQRNDPA